MKLIENIRSIREMDYALEIVIPTSEEDEWSPSDYIPVNKSVTRISLIDNKWNKKVCTASNDSNGFHEGRVYRQTFTEMTDAEVCSLLNSNAYAMQKFIEIIEGLI